MELSGLIFVALALVWAVLLIPMALRHHDEVAKTRSVDKFSDDMRVLARREVVSDREARLVVRPTVEQDRPAGRETATKQRRTETMRRPDASPQAHRRAAAAAARRRRHILVVLLLADLVVGVGVPVGWFLPWAPAIPVAITLVFLVVARVTVRREQRRWSATRAAQLAEPGEVHASQSAEPREELIHQPAPMPETVPPVAAQRNEQGLAVVSGLDDTSSFPVGLLGALEPTTDAGALWDPLPVTLPTYVTKARATRSVRTIDLQEPGVSNSGRDASDSALVAEAASSAASAEEARKAVGS